jgi:Na+-driven multidrug efflux pump
MKERLILKTILLFFLPLLFRSELIQLSHAITNAFLARLLAPKEIIAAFSIAFGLTIMASGVTMATVQTGICFITDRTSFRRLLRYCLILVLLPFSAVELIALTPIGEIVFGDWMGASPGVVSQARWASAIMGFWAFPIMTRNLCYAMAMIKRRTILITYATAVRLVSLIGFLFVFSIWFDGAIVGAMATVAGMTVEAIFMVVATRSYFLNLKKTADQPAGAKEFWSFSWPLMLMQITENGVMFVLNFFLGQLKDPDLAIASFGIVYGLVRIILAGPRNLVQTSQALVHSRGDLRALFQFTSGLILFYCGLIFVLFYTPLNEWILGVVMGLTAELSGYCKSALRLIFLIAIFWSTAATLRGILSSIRKTFVIAVSAGVRLVVIAGIGFFAFLDPHLNGAVLGVFSFAGAFAAETILLGWHLWHQSQKHKTLFDLRGASL